MSVYKAPGRSVYMMEFMFKGQRIYESTGQTSKREALRVQDRRRKDLQAGAAGLREEARLYFFGEAAKDWRAAAPRPKGKRTTPWSPAMEAIADSTLKRILQWFGENRLLADITEKDIHKYQDARQRAGASNRSINMEVGTLRKVLRHAGHWERIKSKVGMLAEREDVGKALSAEQEALLLEECGRSASRGLLPFVTLAIDTGARYNTIRTLQWGRVDLDRGLITLGKDKTAAGTGRTVPLNARALATLMAWAEQFPNRAPEHYVFPTEKYGLHGAEGTFGGEVRPYETDVTKPVGTIKSAWESARRRTRRHCPACKAGWLVDVGKPAQSYQCDGCSAEYEALPTAVSEFRFHDLRHTTCSRLLTAGVPLHLIAKILGWTPQTVVSMAQRYGHFEEEAMRRAVGAVSGGPGPEAASNVVEWPRLRRAAD